MSEEHRNKLRFFCPLWNAKPQTLRSLLSCVYTQSFKYRNYNSTLQFQICSHLKTLPSNGTRTSRTPLLTNLHRLSGRHARSQGGKTRTAGLT